MFGHRPPELGGYEPNFLQAAVQRRLGDILDAQRQLDEDLVLLTGLQLGAEQLLNMVQDFQQVERARLRVSQRRAAAR